MFKGNLSFGVFKNTSLNNVFLAASANDVPIKLKIRADGKSRR